MLKNLRRRMGKLFPWLALSMLCGCAAVERPETVGSGRLWRLPLQPGDIVDLHTGQKLSLDDLINALGKVRLIYVGEVHARMADHEVQHKVIQGLSERGKKIGIGLEMLPRTEQTALDLWVRGALDEEAFLEAAGWEHHWGFPFDGYRPVFTLAREKNLPMRALNAPPTVVRKVSRQGLDSLSDEERRQIACYFFMDDAAHRAYIQEEFRMHMPGGIRDFETFYQAQLVWDETMAESLAVWMVQEPLGHVVVLAGKGHVNQRFGIPERVRRRLEHRYAVVVPVATNEVPEAVRPDVGDYLVVTAAEKPARGHGKRLGLSLQKNPGGKGLRVLEVVPNSRAEKAGFLPGDLLLAVDGEPVEDLEALHRRFRDEPKGVAFTVERGGTVMEIKVDFEP